MLTNWLKFENEFICWKSKWNFCLHFDVFVCLCMLVENVRGHPSLSTTKGRRILDLCSVTSRFLSNKKDASLTQV